MKKAPLISVIIPIYRVEDYLARGLDSIINQTYKNLEIICIDDGSPDDSIKILNRYAKRDSRIKIVRQKNAGAGAARNVGIKIASGEYIHFMDADDTIDLDYYEIMLAAIISGESDMAVSGFISDNKYTPSLEYHNPIVLSGIREKIKGTNGLIDLYVWRYLFNKKFISKNKLFFAADMIAQEESRFILRAVKLANRIAVVPKVLYHYRYNPISILNDRDPVRRKKMKENCKLGRKIRCNFARENGLMWHWRTRKLRKLPIVGKIFK